MNDLVNDLVIDLSALTDAQVAKLEKLANKNGVSMQAAAEGLIKDLLSMPANDLATVLAKVDR